MLSCICSPKETWIKYNLGKQIWNFLLYHQHCVDDNSSKRVGRARVHTVWKHFDRPLHWDLMLYNTLWGHSWTGELKHSTISGSPNYVSVVSPMTFLWLKTFFALCFQMTAVVSQTVSQTAKEAPAPAALTQRFLMLLPRSRERKLIPTACMRSCGTMTQDRLVSLSLLCNVYYVTKLNSIFISLRFIFYIHLLWFYTGLTNNYKLERRPIQNQQ